MESLTIYKPFTLYNKNGSLFAFDAFIKNNFLYLVMPLYKNYPAFNQIQVFVKNGSIILHDDIIKNRREATRILTYKIISQETSGHICAIIYNNRKFTINQNNTNAELLFDNSYLSLTTLCKNDYELIQPFINYYIRNGVERFYIYYNGIITPDIKQNIVNICHKYDISMKKIIFIEWNFAYWHNDSLHSIHHAQLGQMHHALYFFGKSHSQYMIFCDLDEYFYIKNCTIENSLRKNELADTFCFHNSWAKLINKRISEYRNIEFPKKFLHSKTAHGYGWRSKCIHKVSSVKTIDIHKHDLYNNSNPLLCKKNVMFHFYNWTQLGRKIEDIENKHVQFLEIDIDS
jgi:hypothetical protein